MDKERCTHVIALTGGIGSGKSVVSRILNIMGYQVYDCDSRAKSLMDSDPQIRESIEDLFGAGFVENGMINRKRLSDLVFSDTAALNALNNLVHGCVRDDFQTWINSSQESRLLFVETAILYQSGFDRLVDEVWTVVAPERVRIERVMNRNSLTASQVKARIESQENFIVNNPHHNVAEIINDDVIPVLPQVERLLEKYL